MAQANAVPVSGSKLDNRRVLAALIDLVVVGAGWAVILTAAGLLGEGPSEIGAPLVGVMLAWALYYYFACESGSGQTLGKRVMDIRVVRLDGAPAGMREIALRTVLRVIDMQLFYLVGLIVMLGTHERRGRLGDLVAGTMIVSADQPAPTPAAVPEPVAVSRVPIAESGPAFAPAPVEESDAEDLTSPALQELATDVAATAGSGPVEVLEDQPFGEEEPAVEVLEDQPFADGEPVEPEPAEAEPVAAEVEVVAEEPVIEEEPAPQDESAPRAEAEPEQDESEDEVTVRSVETVSAIDLVMDDSRRDS